MIILRQRVYATIPTMPTTAPTPAASAGMRIGSAIGGIAGKGANLLSKAGNFAKQTWNGENGLGKTGNRALIVGGAALGAAALMKKKKEKEQQQQKPAGY